MLLFLGLFMICSFVKLSKESEVTHLFLTMQPNVFVCLKFFYSISTAMLTSELIVTRLAEAPAGLRTCP